MPGVGAGKTILVTGGGGYIGSHCVHELLLEDYNVIAVDNFRNSVPGKQNLWNLKIRITLYLISIHHFLANSRI